MIEYWFDCPFFLKTIITIIQSLWISKNSIHLFTIWLNQYCYIPKLAYMIWSSSWYLWGSSSNVFFQASHYSHRLDQWRDRYPWIPQIQEWCRREARSQCGSGSVPCCYRPRKDHNRWDRSSRAGLVQPRNAGRHTSENTVPYTNDLHLKKQLIRTQVWFFIETFMSIGIDIWWSRKINHSLQMKRKQNVE